MPTDLYRTYQVLIEETVDPQHPKREKTAKNNNFNPDVHRALGVTNELFQDAVCYYTILLTGLAGNEKDGERSLNPLWYEIADDDGKYKTAADTVVRRMAGKFELLNGCGTAAELVERCYERPSDPTLLEKWRQLPARLYRELEGDGTEREDGLPKNCKDMATFASNHTRDLCNPAGKQTPAAQGVRNDNYFAKLMERLKGKGSHDAVAEAIELQWCFLTPSGAEVRGREALPDYVAAFLGPQSSRKLKRPGKYPDLMEAAGKKLLNEWGDEPKKSSGESRAAFNARKAAWEKKAATFPLPSYSTSNKPNQRLWYCLRFKWCRDQAARESLLEQIKDCVFRDVADDATNVVTEWKRLVATKRVFPFFTSLFSGDTNTVWLDFDDAALATAAEDVFKFRTRTLERERKIAKLRAVDCVAMRRADFVAFAREDSPTGKPIVVRGMLNDDRRARMVEVLKHLGGERGLDREYGIDTGTIGGWASVREVLLKLEARGILDDDELVSAVDKCQTENSQGFGSADFFHELCDPDNHSIWSRVGEHSPAAQANGIKDFVAYYARFSEWIEDLSELTDEGAGIKAISYTFPGTPNRFGKTSQRHFNFKARLSTRFVFPKLFTETSGVYALIKTAEERTVTLSARRLKRDRILDAKGESAAALWCPPLVIVEGDARPNAGKREGTPPKMKDVSFSLMVEPRATDSKCEAPVHLNVQLPIESKQVGKLCNGQIFFGEGSLRGYAKKGETDSDKRRLWKWPCDLTVPDDSGGGPAEGSRIKPRDLWCGDGTQGGFHIKKWTESNKGAWKGEPAVVPDFHVLSLDLGNRFCAAFARLRVHRDADDPKRGRMISPEHGWAKPIFAHVFERGILRLQGEDAMVWDHKRGPSGECLKDADGKYLYELQREPFGNDGRGRFPKTDELERFRALARRIVPIENFACRAEEKMTYPELGDHLLYRLKRRLSRTRALFKLRWLAHRDGLEKQNYEYVRRRDDKERAEKRAKAIELIAQAAARPPRDEDEKPDSLYTELLGTLVAATERAMIIPPLEPEEQPEGKKRRRVPKKSKEKAVFRAQCAEFVKGVTEPKWDALIGRIENEIEKMMMGEAASKVLIEQAAGWCLPLRGRHWRWLSDVKKPTLEQGAKDESPEHVPPLMGMRGLSMRRLEQVLNLRQLCQSYAKIERRWLQPGQGVNDIVIKRGEELHDSCRDLLKTSNDLREQRTYQTAHLILTEALGLELMNPAEVEREGKTKKELKSEMDLHGAYKPKTGKDGKPLPRCSVIVLEDLSRYRTSQERTRAENSRLMQWAHRKIIEKLTDMVAPFEIRIMLVDPAFSSRFDSRTGVAGIRVNEVGPGFDKQMPYAAWKKRLNKSGKKADIADRVSEMAKLFETNSGYSGTLLLPVEGGKLFFAARADDGEGHQNADENAAINIGLRALAHPDRPDIFPRLRTVRVNEGAVRVKNRRGWFAARAHDADRELTKAGAVLVAAPVAPEPVASRDEGIEESSEHPDFFAVIAATKFGGLPAGERYEPASLATEQLSPFSAFARPLFLKKVQEASFARSVQVNEARIATLMKTADDADSLP